MYMAAVECSLKVQDPFCKRGNIHAAPGPHNPAGTCAHRSVTLVTHWSCILARKRTFFDEIHMPELSKPKTTCTERGEAPSREQRSTRVGAGAAVYRCATA
jgi:hypothetical protein